MKQHRVLIAVVALATTACTPTTTTSTGSSSSAPPTITSVTEEPPAAEPSELQTRVSTFCRGLTPMVRNFHAQFGGGITLRRGSPDRDVRIEAIGEYVGTAHNGMTSTVALLAELGPVGDEVQSQQAKLSAFLESTTLDLESTRDALARPIDDISLAELNERETDTALLAELNEVRADPDFVPHFDWSPGSKSDCGKLGLEINYVHVVGGCAAGNACGAGIGLTSG